MPINRKRITASVIAQYGSFANYIAALGSTKTTEVIAEDVTVEAPITQPSNVTFSFVNDAKLICSSGAKITNFKVDKPYNHQIISCALADVPTITGVEYVTPEMFGDDINKALNSFRSVKTLDGAIYLIDSPVLMPDNSKVFGGGTLKITSANTDRVIIKSENYTAGGSNDNIILDGLVFDGDNLGTVNDQNTFVFASQWKNVTNLNIKNCHFKNITADGIYLANHRVAGTPDVVSGDGCVDVVIENNTIENFGRNSVSVVCGHDILIKANTFKTVKRTPTIADPGAGVDLEPNTSQFCYNVTVTNNKITDCYRGLEYTAKPSANGNPAGIIRDCVAEFNTITQCTIGSDFRYTTDCKVFGNTINDIDNAGIQVYIQNVRLSVSNNIITECNQASAAGVYSGIDVYQDNVGCQFLFNTIVNKNSPSGQQYNIKETAGNGNASNAFIGNTCYPFRTAAMSIGSTVNTRYLNAESSESLLAPNPFFATKLRVANFDEPYNATQDGFSLSKYFTLHTSGGDESYLLHNCYYGGSPADWRYRESDTSTGAIKILIGDGRFRVYTAPDGTQGNIVPFVEGLRQEGTGNVAILSSLNLTTVGKGISIKEGTNARMGVATLVAGTVTVSNTTVTANTRISLTVQSVGGTEYGDVKVSSRVAGVSFTIAAYRGNNTTTVASGDTSVVMWELKEPA